MSLKSVFGNKYVIKKFSWPSLAKNFYVLKFAESFSQPLYEIRKIHDITLFFKLDVLKKEDFENFDYQKNFKNYHLIFICSL